MSNTWGSEMLNVDFTLDVVQRGETLEVAGNCSDERYQKLLYSSRAGHLTTSLTEVLP